MLARQLRAHGHPIKSLPVGERSFSRNRRQRFIAPGMYSPAADVCPTDLIVVVIVVATAVPPRNTPHLQRRPRKWSMLLGEMNKF